MSRYLIIAVATFFLANIAHAQQVQFFPPQGPCNTDNPILAWNGSGGTYCTRFPTATLPDCKDGQFLTKKNGAIVCSDLSGQNVSAPTAPAPTAPTPVTSTTPAPTTPYNSNGTPTGIPQRVAATGGSSSSTSANSGSGNRSCPRVTIPVCASDSVLVDYGLDYNGCQTSPQCYYVGYGNVAATYAASGYSAPAYVDTYVETVVEPVYVEVPYYVEPYYEAAPDYDDEPYYADDGDEY